MPPSLCFARVSCSLHRPCRVPFLAPSQGGTTAFHLAAAIGCPTAGVLALLAAGADRTATNRVSAMVNKGHCGGPYLY